VTFQSVGCTLSRLGWFIPAFDRDWIPLSNRS
jgi:hypothetical protein